MRLVIARCEPLLARALTETLIAAWVAGTVPVVAKLPPPDAWGRLADAAALPRPVIPPALPPPLSPASEAGGDGGDGPLVRFPLIERAAQDLAARRVMTRQDFDRLAEDARASAFTVSRVAGLDAIEKVRDALAGDVLRGGTLREFVLAVDDAVGRSALSGAHVETVYRTNVLTAYAVGREAILAHPLVSDLFPYRRTVPVRDERLTELCRIISESGLNGTGVFRADDPVWRRFKPPRHWNCRCLAVAMTVEDAAASGIKEAREWLRTGLPPSAPEYVPYPRVELPEGWAPVGDSLVPA